MNFIYALMAALVVNSVVVRKKSRNWRCIDSVAPCLGIDHFVLVPVCALIVCGCVAIYCFNI